MHWDDDIKIASKSTKVCVNGNFENQSKALQQLPVAYPSLEVKYLQRVLYTRLSGRPAAQSNFGGPECRLQICSRLASKWFDSTYWASFSSLFTYFSKNNLQHTHVFYYLLHSFCLFVCYISTFSLYCPMKVLIISPYRYSTGTQI